MPCASYPSMLYVPYRPWRRQTVYHSGAGLVQRDQRDALEILAFGMVQADGMIDRMTESFEDGDFATGIYGSAEDDLLKQIGGDVLGTRKRKKHAAWIEAP